MESSKGGMVLEVDILRAYTTNDWWIKINGYIYPRNAFTIFNKGIFYIAFTLPIHKCNSVFNVIAFDNDNNTCSLYYTNSLTMNKLHRQNIIRMGNLSIQNGQFHTATFTDED
jgi:hypothetical protein